MEASSQLYEVLQFYMQNRVKFLLYFFLFLCKPWSGELLKFVMGFWGWKIILFLKVIVRKFTPPQQPLTCLPILVKYPTAKKASGINCWFIYTFIFDLIECEISRRFLVYRLNLSLVFQDFLDFPDFFNFVFLCVFVCLLRICCLAVFHVKIESVGSYLHLSRYIPNSLKMRLMKQF